MSEPHSQKYSEKGSIRGDNAQQQNNITNNTKISFALFKKVSGLGDTGMLPNNEQPRTQLGHENNIISTNELHNAEPPTPSKEGGTQARQFAQKKIKRHSFLQSILFSFKKYPAITKSMFYFSIIVFLGIVFSTWFHSGNQVGPSTHSSPKGSPPSLIKQPPSPTPTLTSTPQFFSPTPIPTPQNTPPPPTVSAGISTPTAQDIYNQYLSRSPSQEDATLNGSVWSWTTARGDCQFTNGQYHTIQSNAQSYSACIASSAGKVTNIAIQTQVVINQGDTAGLIFGFQSSSSYYEFGFCINSVCVPGTVSLWRTTSPTSAYCAWPASQPDCNQIFSCVKTHLGDKNILTAILLKDTVYLYVNGQSVSPALQPFDSANPYGSGNFGVAVFDNRNATDATFTNVKIWYLSP